MATERLSMRKTKEILRQKWALKRSHRDIAKSAGVSVGVVWSAITRAKEAGLASWEEVEPLDEATLEAMLYGASVREELRPEPDCQWIHRERPRVGVTLASALSRNDPGLLARSSPLSGCSGLTRELRSPTFDTRPRLAPRRTQLRAARKPLRPTRTSTRRDRIDANWRAPTRSGRLAPRLFGGLLLASAGGSLLASAEAIASSSRSVRS